MTFARPVTFIAETFLIFYTATAVARLHDIAVVHAVGRARVARR